jgi:nucleoside permease NupC
MMCPVSISLVLIHSFARLENTETFNCIANMFVDQSQAPLMIKPALDDVTESELHAIMTSGFSSTAGSVLGKAYVVYLCT